MIIFGDSYFIIYKCDIRPIMLILYIGFAFACGYLKKPAFDSVFYTPIGVLLAFIVLSLFYSVSNLVVKYISRLFGFVYKPESDDNPKAEQIDNLKQVIGVLLSAAIIFGICTISYNIGKNRREIHDNNIPEKPIKTVESVLESFDKADIEEYYKANYSKYDMLEMYHFDKSDYDKLILSYYDLDEITELFEIG